MFDQNYEDQVNRIGRLGSFAPGDYVCKCISCERTFQGDKRARQCLPCTISALVAMYSEARDLLGEHHNWHQQEGLEMKLGDSFFDCASCYVDSTLEMRTTSALSQWVIRHVPETEKA